MAKKKSKETSIEEILQDAVNSQWCIVNTENVFEFDSNTYTIDGKVTKYTVFNKPKYTNGAWNEWTNDCLMVSILCVDTGEEMRFFDESLGELNADSIKLS